MNGNGTQKLTGIERKKKRLELYYEREEHMLSPDGIQAYGIGSRNVERYNINLARIQSQIKELENEIGEEESVNKPRRAVAIVPRDW